MWDRLASRSLNAGKLRDATPLIGEASNWLGARSAARPRPAGDGTRTGGAVRTSALQRHTSSMNARPACAVTDMRGLPGAIRSDAPARIIGPDRYRPRLIFKATSFGAFGLSKQDHRLATCYSWESKSRVAAWLGVAPACEESNS